MFHKNTFDGFHIELQRMLSPRFGANHKVSFGQRNQEEPPSAYGVLSHYAAKNGVLLVGSWNTAGNIMARVIKESMGGALLASYVSQTTQKGEEHTSTEVEYSHSSLVSSYGLKYTHQMTPQGGGGVVEGSFVRRMTPGLSLGLHGLLIPAQGRVMPSFTARYERAFATDAQEGEWMANAERAYGVVEKLTEIDPISAYDAGVIAAAFFKPRWVAGIHVSPVQMALDLSYVRYLSPSIKLGTQLSFHPPPPNPNNPHPSIQAKWHVGYEYNAEPSTSVKVHLTNLESIACIYEDSITEEISVSVSATANWPKDAYKTGFGITMRY